MKWVMERLSPSGEWVLFNPAGVSREHPVGKWSRITWAGGDLVRQVRALSFNAAIDEIEAGTRTEPWEGTHPVGVGVRFRPIIPGITPSQKGHDDD